MSTAEFEPTQPFAHNELGLTQAKARPGLRLRRFVFKGIVPDKLFGQSRVDDMAGNAAEPGTQLKLFGQRRQLLPRNGECFPRQNLTLFRAPGGAAGQRPD